MAIARLPAVFLWSWQYSGRASRLCVCEMKYLQAMFSDAHFVLGGTDFDAKNTQQFAVEDFRQI